MIRDVLVTWVLLTQWQLQLNRLWCVSVRARRLIQGWIDSEKGTLLTATTDCPTKCLSNHHILRLLKTLDGWNCFQATQFVAVVSCFLSADICRCWWTGHCRRELRNLRNFTLLIPTSWIIYNTYIYIYDPYTSFGAREIRSQVVVSQTTLCYSQICMYRFL